MNRVIGIDVGLKGGVACLYVDKLALDLQLFGIPIAEHKGKNEYDLDQCFGTIRMLAPDPSQTLVVIEKSLPYRHKSKDSEEPMPEGVKSIWSMARGFTIFEMCAVTLGCPRLTPAPITWHTDLKLGKGDPKLAAYKFASARFPGMNWKRTDRCRGPHWGFTDAACIAYWGYRTTIRRPQEAHNGTDGS